MRHFFNIIFAAALAALPLASCEKTPAQEGDGGMCDVTLHIGLPVQTRAGYTTVHSDETAVRSGYLFVFDESSSLEAEAELDLSDWSSSTGGSVSLRLQEGYKSIYVLLNTPDIRSSVTSSSDILGYRFEFSDELNGETKYFQMRGELLYANVSGSSCTFDMSVERVASRVVLRSFTNNYADITIKSAWLSNVTGDRCWTSESSINTWYNIQGRYDRTQSHIISSSSDADLAPMTYCTINESILKNTAFTNATYALYCYPNPSTTTPNGFTSSFNGEYTTLVVETEIDGTTHYYSVPICNVLGGCSMPIVNNYSYAVNITVNGPGSPDPNDPDDRVPVAPHAPLTTEAEFTITIEPWVTGASYTEEI